MNLISSNKAVKNPKWTVGVTVEIKLYKYMEGTPRQRNCFVEMWDIGGSSNHKNTRDIFYSTIHGLIVINNNNIFFYTIDYQITFVLF